MDERKEMLLHMYDQMFNDINRHIMVVWQSVGVVIGAFAIFALVEKNVVSIDVATSLIILLCSWLISHLFDASYWYNRNLIIIANIERQFLDEDDLKNIHYYFGKHRKSKMITHLRLQFWLAIGVSTIVLYAHFSDRVLPGIGLPIEKFEFIRALPYVFSILAIAFIVNLKAKTNTKYDTFLKNSPGIDINTSNIDYSNGHGQ